MLGAKKMPAAVAFGASLMALCVAFPAALPGVLLLFSGLELALVARDQTARDAAFIMRVTAGVSLGLNNIALGTLAGLLVSGLMRPQPTARPQEGIASASGASGRTRERSSGGSGA